LIPIKYYIINVGFAAIWCRREDFFRLRSPSQSANYAKITLINLKFPSLDENHPFFGHLPIMPRR
jgi:hypothetical protein